MENKILFAATLSTFLLLLSPTAFAYLELSVLDDSHSVYLNEEVSFDFILENKRYVEDPVQIIIRGEHQEWIQNTYTLIKMEGNSENRFSIKFYPTGDVSGDFHYTMRAESFITKVGVQKDFYLEVKRPVEITWFDAEKSGDRVQLEVSLLSNAEKTATLNFELLGKDKRVIDAFSRDIDLEEGENSFGETVSLSEKMPAGDYMITVILDGTKSFRTASFTVMPLHDVVENVVKRSTPLYDEYEITIYNNGNVVEDSYTVNADVPNNDLITGLITSPTGCVDQGENKECRYVLTDLEPGATALITYRLDYWSIYAQYSLIVIAILGVTALGFFRAASPTIRKKAVRKGGDKHHVVLEIKNPFYHNLSNVIVRDWVSPLASVAHDEIAMFKPVVRRSDAGTELIWRLGDMRPRETRIITYPIKTLVQGSLKMPRAYIRYNKPSGKFSRIFSKQLIVE